MIGQQEIGSVIRQQRNFFNSGKTKDILFRIAQLKKLKQAISDHKEAVIAALKADLKKPDYEIYETELLAVKEIDYTLKQIKNWTKPKKVSTSLEQFPSAAIIYPEPLGVVLIISAWNYPFNLIISPLIGAIAAGNCAILKPSEIAPNTSQVIADIFQKNFDPAYIAVVEGGVETTQNLLTQKFDHIFFTGATAIGKIIMEAAAKNLTPVTLELGGKSPCIVDREINVEYAARRITWGKFINAGQTCVAPDYLLVDRKIKPNLVDRIKKCLREFYGDDPAASPDYARIINQKHFARVASFLKDGEVIIGGETDASNNYIAPTVMEKVSLDSPIMQEEIFGPILPIIEYDNLSEAISFINERPKPLALYFFSKNQENQKRVWRETSSGGVCINDTIMHLIGPDLPFGGVGNSGMGSYHGKASFDTFSHQKSLLKNNFLIDIKLRYAPYANKLHLIKWMVGL